MDWVAGTAIIKSVGAAGCLTHEGVREGVYAAVRCVRRYRHGLGDVENGFNGGDPIVFGEEGEVVGGCVVIGGYFEKGG